MRAELARFLLQAIANGPNGDVVVLGSRARARQPSDVLHSPYASACLDVVPECHVCDATEARGRAVIKKALDVTSTVAKLAIDTLAAVPGLQHGVVGGSY